MGSICSVIAAAINVCLCSFLPTGVAFPVETGGTGVEDCGVLAEGVGGWVRYSVLWSIDARRIGGLLTLTIPLLVHSLR